MNSFRKMLDAKIIKRTDNGQFIRFEHLHVKPGFNKRDHDDDWEAAQLELVAFLDAGGEVPPLEVVPRDEGGVWIVEGHRRQDGFRRLLASGKPVEWIHIKQFNGNDAERLARIATSNSQLALKPLERASVYADLRALNWTPADIARRVGKDVAHVARHLALIDSNTDVQQMVREGTVKPTVAVQHVKEHGEKAGTVLAEKLEQAKAQGKKRVTGERKPPKLAVPDGWRLVPLDPTPEMLSAFQDSGHRFSEDAYRAMLDIAPQPEGAA